MHLVEGDTVQLTERQERILKAIVDTYIATARPVGSTAMVEKSGLNVSSATVRNEMAVLEEFGYLRHLHTSGGRVPTNLGYRYYVERLMDSGHLPSAEARTIRHQFHQAHTEVQEWLKLAATVMATRMHNVGLVTAPRSSDIRLRHLEVIGIQNTVALLIVVLQDGTILQEMLTLTEASSQEQLSALSDRLTRDLRGLTAAQIQQRTSSLPSPDSYIGTMVGHLLRRGEEQHTQVYHAGLADMIRQPEFLQPRTGETLQSTNERLRKMVEFLHQGIEVERLLSGVAHAHDVQVVIGSDATDELEDYSFVLGRYGDDAESIGFLGVIGPTRMEYPRAVALVRYMSTLMTDLMQAY
jgi:heat-inducible transcriptional repressor